jgi:hypothetical protein
MKDLNPRTHPLAYIFGIPGLIAFSMTLGLGLWPATICIAFGSGLSLASGSGPGSTPAKDDRAGPAETTGWTPRRCERENRRRP